MPNPTSNPQAFRAQSRKEWVAPENKKPTIEQLQLGALQRIADATERMAQSHEEILASRDRYKKWYEDAQRARKIDARSAAALRGQITRLRRELDEARAAGAAAGGADV